MSDDGSEQWIQRALDAPFEGLQTARGQRQGQVPFGKYRGYPLECLDNDPTYVAWLLSQDWLAERYPDVHAHITQTGITALPYCAALNRNGTECTYHAKYGDKCKRHFRRDAEPDFTAWESELAMA